MTRGDHKPELHPCDAENPSFQTRTTFQLGSDTLYLNHVFKQSCFFKTFVALSKWCYNVWCISCGKPHLASVLIARLSPGIQLGRVSGSSAQPCQPGWESFRGSVTLFSNLELGAQLPLVTLRQGEGELCEDVGEDEEELHVGELGAGARSLAGAVRQETLLVLDHLGIVFQLFYDFLSPSFHLTIDVWYLALLQEMVWIKLIRVGPPPRIQIICYLTLGETNKNATWLRNKLFFILCSESPGVPVAGRQISHHQGSL